jgi:hypothetical protein
MSTIDNLLKRLVNNVNPTIEDILSKRDAKVLRSLTSSIKNNWFVTANQAALIEKILSTNQSILATLDKSIDINLIEPSWSRSFRHIVNIRKMYISENNKHIILECTYTAVIRSIIKKLDNIAIKQVENSKLYQADLTENNIVILVDTLKLYDFIISDELENYYNIIISWDKTDIENQYSNIPTELANETDIIKHDRRFRHQYVSNYRHEGTELTDIIANRKSTKIWVDNKKYSIENVIASLMELKRLPILFVFDTFSYELVTLQMQDISTALKNNGIDNDIGIYFRLSSKIACGPSFNELIANNNYNCILDDTTKIVGIDYCKIPKFLFNWEPMSVVSINNNLRNSKTAIYANRCDLILTYSSHEPII